jgi:hypothetical protein
MPAGNKLYKVLLSERLTNQNGFTATGILILYLSLSKRHTFNIKSFGFPSVRLFLIVQVIQCCYLAKPCIGS